MGVNNIQMKRLTDIAVIFFQNSDGFSGRRVLAHGDKIGAQDTTGRTFLVMGIAFGDPMFGCLGFAMGGFRFWLMSIVGFGFIGFMALGDLNAGRFFKKPHYSSYHP